MAIYHDRGDEVRHPAGTSKSGICSENSLQEGGRSGKGHGEGAGRGPQMRPENLQFLAEGLMLVGIIAWLFYDSPVAAVFLLPLLIPYCRRRVGEKRGKDKKELSAQFREMLAAMITALKAGYSPENAFAECRREMQFQFGEKALITREMVRIEKGLDNHMALEKLLREFASRWEIEEIREFAEVFSIARKSGGDLTEILGRTSSLIQDRMEIDTEIDLLLSSRKLEQKIMAGVPFFIIFYLGLSSEGFFSVLYHNAGGIVFMTICLFGYLAAILLSDRIMAIEL